MIRLAMVSAALILGGCKTDFIDGDKCKRELQTTETYTGTSGLVLQPSEGMFLTTEEIEQAYTQTQQCTGLSATRGPTVAFRSFKHFGLDGLLGFFMRVDRLVWVNNDDDAIDGVAMDCKLQRQVLRHELVHFLLDANGFSPAANDAHDSDFFDTCGKIST